MNDTDKVEFNIQVNIADATDEELDRFTHQLLSELRELDVESVELAKSDLTPKGSKGDPITLGSIAIEILPIAIPSVITLVQSWISRGQGRTIKFKGRGIEFEGSPEEFQKLLVTLEKGKDKK